MDNDLPPVPDVSICIPVYNRQKHVRLLLESIARQPAAINIEVIVRDNASTDDTRGIFDSIGGDRSNWTFIQNGENIGGKRNIRLCTEPARGRYIWIVGSDDRLKDNAIDELKGLIALADENKALAIHTNPRLPQFLPARVIAPPYSWLRHVGVNDAGFISSVIWQSAFWRTYPYDSYAPRLTAR